MGTFPMGFLLYDRKFQKDHEDFLRDIIPVISLEKHNNIPVVIDKEYGISNAFANIFTKIQKYFVKITY